MNTHKIKEKLAGLRPSEAITILGVILLLVVFPLFTWDMYYDILYAKYKFFWITGLAMAGGSLLAALIENRKIPIRERLSTAKPERLDGAERAVLVFLMACGLSTLLSDYRYESMWGNEGRLCGLFFLIVCVLMYFTVERRMKFRSWLVDLFLISAMAVCLWGIADFFRMDPFHFKVDLSDSDRNSFTSSFGNINTYTAFVALACGITATLFLEARSVKANLWYGTCMILSFFAIITGQSDNAYLSLGALFAFLPYYGFRTGRRTARYFAVLAIFATVMEATAWVCETFSGKVIGLSGLFRVVTERNIVLPAAVILWVIALGSALLIKVREESWREKVAKKLLAIWTGLIALAAAAVIYILYKVNTAPDPSVYGSLTRYLLLNDDWGTNRLYAWRIGWENYLNFSPIHKIFGYGPETYGILTVHNNLRDMVDRYNVKYDNAHNEYIQYFFTIGPVGLMAYLSALFFSIRQIAKKAAHNPYAVGLAMAVICYCTQAAVNIATPLVFPFVWLFLAMGLSAGRKNAKM